MFKDITIKNQIDSTGYWYSAWRFKYKDNKYGNMTDNGKRDESTECNAFGCFKGITDKKLTCDVQIAMLENMLEAMKRLIKES